MEDNDLIKAVEELGAKDFSDLAQDLFLHRLVALFLCLCLVFGCGKTEGAFSLDEFNAGIAGHDDDAVLKVNRATMTIGEPTVIHNLKQGIEDLRMRFFNLIQQDNAIGSASDCLSELPTFLKTDVSRRCADEPGDGVLLLVLGHVQTHHSVLIVKEEPGKSARQFGLSHAGRTEEHKATDGSFRVFQPGTTSPYCLRDGGNGFFLVYQTFVESFLHMQQLLCFTLKHLGDRNARPAGNEFRDMFAGDHFLNFRLLEPGFLGFVVFFFQGQSLRPQLCRLFVLLALGSGFLFIGDLLYLLLQGLNVGRGTFGINMQFACRLINQVNGFVR